MSHVNSTHDSHRSWRTWPVAGVMVGSLIVAWLFEPITQDLSYHHFADNRRSFGIDHFANVVSNTPFLMVGLLGLLALRTLRDNSYHAWTVFFTAIALVAVGSAYYHLAPGNDTLVWDRLPIAVAIMALLVAVLTEHRETAVAHRILWLAVVVATGAVAWWYVAEDLRLYAWAQFAPLLAIVVVLALCTPRYSHRRYLAFGLACYGVAKGFEFYDTEVYALTEGVISGHTLKHLFAALAPGCVWWMLRRRHRLS
jgi:hypothetical protein